MYLSKSCLNIKINKTLPIRKFQVYMVSLVNLIKYFRKNINFTQTQKIEEKVAERKLHKTYLIKDLYIKKII